MAVAVHDARLRSLEGQVKDLRADVKSIRVMTFTMLLTLLSSTFGFIGFVVST